MSKWFWLLTFLFIWSKNTPVAGQTGISPETKNRSVIFYVKRNAGSDGDFKELFLQSASDPVRSLKQTAFAGANVGVYFEDSRDGLRTFAGTLTRTYPLKSFVNLLNGKAPPKPFEDPLFHPALDAMIRIDLTGPLSADQIAAIGALRQTLSQFASVSVSLTDDYVMYDSNETNDSDVLMGFINRWKQDADRQTTTDYWLNHHGPYALSLGLPKEILKYEQDHTELTQPDDSVFDTDYQGICFETIQSYDSLYGMSLNPRDWDFNSKLVIDEQNFTPSPLFLLFKKTNL